MIPAETRYETHDGKLLTIIEIFKTWRHYLEEAQHEILVFTDHNNLRQFIETKSFNSRQVCLAQKLSHYHFWIDYCQGKANGAADTLSRYSQWSAEEEETLCTKNVKNLHRLQSFLSNASLLGFSTSAKLSSLHRVLIRSTHVLPQLRQFWDTFRAKLGAAGPYWVSISAMCLRLLELQESDNKAQKIKVEGLKSNYEEVDRVLHHQELFFVPEAIQTELIN